MHSDDPNSDRAITEALHAVLTSGDDRQPSSDRVSELRNMVEQRRAIVSDAVPVDDPAPLHSTVSPVIAGANRSRWTMAAAAGLLLVLGTGLGALVFGSNGSDPVPIDGTVEYAGPISGPGGTGELSVVEIGIGRVVDIRTSDLEILPTGEYYEVWFVGPGDSASTPNRISAGTFHPAPDGSSVVTFAAAVNPVLYPLVEVTAEPGDGDPTATGPVVLSVEIPPAE